MREQVACHRGMRTDCGTIGRGRAPFALRRSRCATRTTPGRDRAFPAHDLRVDQMLRCAHPVPVASLVVTLDGREPLRRGALSRLVADARIDLGEASGAYLPIVIDTLTAQEGEELVESLLVTPGVLGVDLVGVDFSLDGDP